MPGSIASDGESFFCRKTLKGYFQKDIFKRIKQTGQKVIHWLNERNVFFYYPRDDQSYKALYF